MPAQRPRPARRRFVSTLILTIFAITLLITPATALPHNTELSLRNLLHSYASRGEILTDGQALQRRQAMIKDETVDDGADSTPPSGDHIPEPFDTSLGSNFTTNTCPDFFTSFLSNTTFQSCVPVSLLLQNSQGFMDAQTSAPLIQSILDNACTAPLSVCGPLMTNLAAELITTKKCGADFANRQPLVIQAYNGLLAYEVLAKATCLKTDDYNSSTAAVSADTKDDNNEAEYCFLRAITNKKSSSDPFPYYTAVGMTLPTAASPTCNSCLKQTMRIFADYAVRAENPLSITYAKSAEIIEAKCGAGYADTHVHVGSVQGSLSNTATQDEKKTSSSAAASAARPPVLAGLLVVLVLACLSLL